MCTDYRQELVLLQECRDSVETEKVRTTSDLVRHEGSRALLGRLRAAAVFLGLQRVGPQEIAQQAFAGRFLEAVDSVDRLDIWQFRRQPTMDHQELPVDRGCERQVVERVHKSVVHADVILVLAFLAEVEEAGHLAALVVAPEHPHPLRVANFQCVHRDHDLHGEGAAVNVVAQEDVLRVARRAANLEQLDQIIVLAVDVANHCDGVVQL
mmetsp:Transcript_124433/g.244054  ORF Transcript_124433/g.244054 Transcript_124433/m.244054 type:complete len:210 (+) Transcript_124433:920-1549(+)